jgi:hypothetical protein
MTDMSRAVCDHSRTVSREAVTDHCLASIISERRIETEWGLREVAEKPNEQSEDFCPLRVIHNTDDCHLLG